MENAQGRVEERDRQYRRMAPRLGLVAAAVLGMLGMAALLPPRPGEAQGGEAGLIRQLQGQNTSLTQVQRQQQMMIQRLNSLHTADLQRLQRFQNAVNAAAAAGDPTARAVRSGTPDAALDKLTTQFNDRARKQRAAGAPVTSTDLTAPDLSGARLSGAMMRGAKLTLAILIGTDLTKAELINATLQGANLRSAKLQGTDLTGADLTGADLTNALYDAHTRWPAGFDPARHNAMLVQ
jgi:uncharacterized protein YjbI with pentapeptide repeats